MIRKTEPANADLWVCLYRPVVTSSPLERGQGVCEFSLIDIKITHPLSPLERGNRYSRRYVINTKYPAKSSFIAHICQKLNLSVFLTHSNALGKS